MATSVSHSRCDGCQSDGASKVCGFQAPLDSFATRFCTASFLVCAGWRQCPSGAKTRKLPIRHPSTTRCGFAGLLRSYGFSRRLVPLKRLNRYEASAAAQRTLRRRAKKPLPLFLAAWASSLRVRAAYGTPLSIGSISSSANSDSNPGQTFSQPNPSNAETKQLFR
jgi:hypothetical protein